jgi:hypothetical protein
VNWVDFAIEKTLESRSKYKAAVGGLVKKRTKLQEQRDGDSLCDSKIIVSGNPNGGGNIPSTPLGTSWPS